MTLPLVLTGKAISLVSRVSGRGNGSTWPGHIAMQVNPHFIEQFVRDSSLDIIFVVGTNGKTTTAKMISTILEEDNHTVIQNTAGANLENGIASTFIRYSSLFGKIKKDYAVFEVDENNLPLLLQQITPRAIVVMNLFRDQLDRYGELNTIANKWKKAFEGLDENTTLVLNGDDPLISYLAESTKAQVCYFGLDKKTPNRKEMQHAADSLFCPRCSTKLIYDYIFFSHNGIWHCPHCKFSHPEVVTHDIYYPLPGIYNRYNTQAAVTVAKHLGINKKSIDTALPKIVAAFGRQEVITYHEKEIQIFLSKNPTSFNESLATIEHLKARDLLIVLNDRIPDGHDISWIWDVDIEEYTTGFDRIIVSGDRTYDMALRLEYANISPEKVVIEPDLSKGISQLIATSSERVYILPTYSAMLDVRKIVTGKKIL